MSDNKFTRVIVIGYGVIAGKVLRYVDEKSVAYRYSVKYIEHEPHVFNEAAKYAEANNVDCQIIEDKKSLSDYFMSLIDEKILIISASNNYIFPNQVIEKRNVVIINFHNALLPQFPGRNAPSWAIFEQQKITGITWHYVTSKIDEGDIIVQKEYKLPWNIKAYELVAALMHLAFDAFQECFESVLQENAQTICQSVKLDHRMYKSTEIPGNGHFELTDPPEDIYRLLRALDYGKNKIFPLPQTEYRGKTIQIRRYKIVSNRSKKEVENIINIPFDNDNLLQMRYDIIYADGKSGGGIDSIAFLHEFVAELKKANRKLISNCYLSEARIGLYIDKDNLFYTYVPMKYLNIWHKERDFVRLYYYIADLDFYEIPDIDVKIVCDQFYQKETEKAVAVNTALAASSAVAARTSWERAL